MDTRPEIIMGPGMTVRRLHPAEMFCQSIDRLIEEAVLFAVTKPGEVADAALEATLIERTERHRTDPGFNRQMFTKFDIISIKA